MSQYQNIVALFSKALRMDIDSLSRCERQIGDRQIVLGYFDALQLYPLDWREPSGWIEEIWEENKRIAKRLDGRFYYHPLHLAADFQEEANERRQTREQVEADYASFWEGEEPYTFLSLIQVSGNGTLAQLRDIIRKELRSRPHVRCVCYHSLELSDLSLFWKSGSPTEILQLLQKLYQSPCFGDLNTFPTVSYEYVKSWVSDPSSETSSKTSGEVSSKAPLLYISTQYAVKKPERVEDYLTALPPNESLSFHFVSGIDDLQICAQAAERWLLEFLQKSLFDEKERKAYHDAFYDSSTQVGITYDFRALPLQSGPSQGEPPQPENQKAEDKEDSNPITDMCSTLLNGFRKIDGLEDGHSSWHKAVVSLLNAMTDMSRNWVLDGFCYLTLESAQSFYRWITLMHRNKLWGQASGNYQLQMIQKFVRGWGDLMDQATRTDGHYLQMPGFSPSFSEIPSKLLEFYLAFTKRCIHVSRLANSDPDNTSLMLVPKICRRIKVYSIFKDMRPVIRRIRDSGGIEKSHLLYVDIPLSMLYNPKLVMCCLAHEQAHFYNASSWRNRDLRRQMLLGAASTELAIHLLMNTQEAMEAIFASLKKALCKAENKTEEAEREQDTSSKDLAVFTKLEDSDRLLALMQYAVADAVREDFESWRNLCIPAVQLQSQQSPDAISPLEWHVITNAAAQELLHKRNNFTHLLNNLVYLFRECYADITMIALMDLTMEEYLSLTERESLVLLAEGEKKERYCVIVERWAAVIHTVWPERETALAQSQGKFREDIARYLARRNIPEGQPGLEDGYHNVNAIAFLEEYLSVCWRSIRDGLGKIDLERKNSPADIFRKIAREHTAESTVFNELIQAYRKTLTKHKSVAAEGQEQ